MLIALGILAVLVIAGAGLALAPQIIEWRRRPMDAHARTDMPGALSELSLGQTHYHWIGPVRGPIAVCVHGLTTPSFVWRSLAAGLGALGYRVLVYDLYGRGYSDRPAGQQTPEVFVRQLEDLLADQGISEDFTLIGYSMGGVIATCFAAHHAKRIRQLILLAPAGIEVNLDSLTRRIIQSPVLGTWLMGVMYPRMHRAGIAREEARVTPEFADVFDLQRRELDYRGWVPSVLQSLRGMLGRSFEAEHRRLYAAGVPVLAIWGRQDEIIPITALGKLTQWNRNAVQQVVDAAGHGLPYSHSAVILDTLAETLRDGLR